MDLGLFLLVAHIFITIIAAVLLLAFFTAPAKAIFHQKGKPIDNDDENNDDQGGLREFDVDAPLDLPPGIYVVPDGDPEPAPVA